MQQFVVTFFTVVLFFSATLVTGCQSRSHSASIVNCSDVSEFSWYESDGDGPLWNIDRIIEYTRQCKEIDRLALLDAIEKQNIKGTEYWECTDGGPKVGKLPIDISLRRGYFDERVIASATVRGALPGLIAADFESNDGEIQISDVAFLSREQFSNQQIWLFITSQPERKIFRFDIDIDESAVVNYIFSGGISGEGKGTGVFLANPIPLAQLEAATPSSFERHRQSTPPAAVLKCTSNWYPKSIN